VRVIAGKLRTPGLSREEAQVIRRVAGRLAELAGKAGPGRRGAAQWPLGPA
jgi:hypothetical protein